MVLLRWFWSELWQRKFRQLRWPLLTEKNSHSINMQSTVVMASFIHGPIAVSDETAKHSFCHISIFLVCCSASEFVMIDINASCVYRYRLFVGHAHSRLANWQQVFVRMFISLVNVKYYFWSCPGILLRYRASKETLINFVSDSWNVILCIRCFLCCLTHKGIHHRDNWTHALQSPLSRLSLLATMKPAAIWTWVMIWYRWWYLRKVKSYYC